MKLINELLKLTVLIIRHATKLQKSYHPMVEKALTESHRI